VRGRGEKSFFLKTMFGILEGWKSPRLREKRGGREKKSCQESDNFPGQEENKLMRTHEAALKKKGGRGRGEKKYSKLNSEFHRKQGGKREKKGD